MSNEKKPYSKPKSIDLGKVAAAQGAGCSLGDDNTFVCTTGGSNSNGCWNGGVAGGQGGCHAGGSVS